MAAVHGKSHDNVLKLIRRRVAEAGDWGVVNFNETSYIGSNGETYPMFTMTKDGYAFLVGRMTGKKAVEHQIAYIMGFNAMEAYIKNQREGLQYRCITKELECKDSFRRGSVHGKGLRQRQLEKPVPNVFPKASVDVWIPVFSTSKCCRLSGHSGRISE